MWIKNYYWKVETISCVLVERNQCWFENSVQELANLWAIVDKERVNETSPYLRVHFDCFISNFDLLKPWYSKKWGP